jgi:hypothetical protein
MRTSVCTAALAVTISLILTGCSSLPNITTREHTDLEVHLEKIERVVIVPPQVVIELINIDGDNERLSEKETTVSDTIVQQTSSMLVQQGYELVTFDFDQAVQDDPELAYQITQISQSYEQAKQDLQAGRPVTEANKRSYEATMGKAVISVAAKADADAVCLLHYSGFKKSKAMVSKDVGTSVLVGLVTLGYMVPVYTRAGALFEAALVDGVTGDVLWMDMNSGPLNTSIADPVLMTLPKDIDVSAAASEGMTP